MAQLIKFNAELPEEIKPKYEETLTLKELQDYVGGYIELLRSLDGEYFLVIDEEGKLKGKELNISATMVARSFFGLHRSDFIVGDAVLCHTSEMK